MRQKYAVPGGKASTPVHSEFGQAVGTQTSNVLAGASLDMRCFSSASTRAARRNTMLPSEMSYGELRAFLVVTCFQPRDKKCDHKSADEGH